MDDNLFNILNSKKNKSLLLAISAILIFFSGWGGVQLENSLKNKTLFNSQISKNIFPIVSPSIANNRETSTVVRVIDGDTIEIENGQKVRLIGINTPETVDPRRPVQCFGLQASDWTKTHLTGRQIQMEKDVSETDRYGRLLRYIYLNGVMVNVQLVAEGLAQVSTFPPDVKYQDIFKSAQNQAMQAGRGLWSGECFISPSPSKKIKSTPTPVVSGRPCVCPPCEGEFCKELPDGIDMPCYCID